MPPQYSIRPNALRFLPPVLWEHKGVSLMMSPNMLCLCDVRELLDAYDPAYAVQIVQHETPAHKSALILFNNSLCHRFYTPTILTETTDEDLHQFSNIPTELIGELPSPFSYLVGYSNQQGPAKIVQFVNGSPHTVHNQEYAQEWSQSLNDSIEAQW
jgi:hypothetical protein